MISLQPLNQPPGPLPDIRRDYPAALDHYTRWRRGPDGNQNYAVEFIVVHNTEGRDSRKWLSSTSAPDPVSIHKLVRREGVYSIVPPAHTAWHAGNCMLPYTAMNARSLGVEIESINHDGQAQEPYTDNDYNFTAQTVAGWMFSYAVPWERVLRHADIAAPPGRRHDPSGLDWARLQRETYAWLRFMTALKVTERGQWII